MHKRNNIYLLLLGAVILVTMALVSCKEDNPVDPPEENPQELITTVNLSLSDSATATVVTATWKDLDGDGGGVPTIDTLILAAGTTYFGTIELLDESATPADTISHEVEEEANAHQFFYTATGGVSARVSVERTDLDTNAPPLPVGLEYTVRVTAGGTASGALHIVLSHYDAVPKTANPSPESDIDISIPVRIQ